MLKIKKFFDPIMSQLNCSRQAKVGALAIKDSFSQERRQTLPVLAYSFIIDEDPRFAYEGWHLARSIVEHCGAAPSSIHIQCTPEVPISTRELFRAQGYEVHQIERFGDGRYCNKLS